MNPLYTLEGLRERPPAETALSPCAASKPAATPDPTATLISSDSNDADAPTNALERPEGA